MMHGKWAVPLIIKTGMGWVKLVLDCLRLSSSQREECFSQVP
ncbi:hypothetical protein XGA_0962 [Xanthomonas hortorum ATCC 19865]|nr:hypothetical protein XGA_0962 [Xanthomonas hortorum ATCC 19865]